MTSDTLSRTQIVQAAIELLDAEGPEGLSMRRLGTRLGSGATSIYWYVKNKDELLEVAADEVFAEVELPDPDELGWRAATTAMAMSTRAMILRHPWLPMVTAIYPTGGRNTACYQDHLIRVFESAGFTSEHDWALQAVFAYLIGGTAGEAAWRMHLRRTGTDLQKHLDEVVTNARKVADGLPRLLARYDALSHEDMTDPTEGFDRTFELGLQAVLDGVAAQLPSGT